MKKSLIKNAIYKVLLNFFNLVIPLLIGPYVFRTLGETIGRVKYAESIFNYFFIFAAFGIYQYGMREISRIKNDPNKVAKLFTNLFTISVLTNTITLILYLALAFIGFRDAAIFPVLLVFGIAFISNVFYVEWMNEAFESYDFITIKTIAVKIIYVILLVTIIKSSDDYLWFTALLVLSMVLNNIISFIYIKKKVPFDFSVIQIKPFIKPLFLVVIFLNASILYTQLDIFMLGRFISEESVSHYIMSWQIMLIINTVLLSVVQVTIPRLSHLLANNDDSTYINLLHRVARVYFLILTPAAIGLYLISDIGVIVYGGEKFAGAGTVLSVFAVYMVILGIDTILANQVMYVKGKENILVRFVFLGGAINIALNFLCLYFDIFTPENAIATTAIASLIVIVTEYYYIRTKLRIPFKLFTKQTFKYLLISLLFFPITYIVKIFTDNIYWQFVFIVLVNATYYVGALLIMKDDLVMDMIKKIKNRRK